MSKNCQQLEDNKDALVSIFSGFLFSHAIKDKNTETEYETGYYSVLVLKRQIFCNKFMGEKRQKILFILF